VSAKADVQEVVAVTGGERTFRDALLVGDVDSDAPENDIAGAGYLFERSADT